jgi:hypothetical protein
MYNDWKGLGLIEKTTLIVKNEKKCTEAATKEVELPRWSEVKICKANSRTGINAEWVSCPVEKTGNQRI